MTLTWDKRTREESPTYFIPLILLSRWTMRFHAAQLLAARCSRGPSYTLEELEEEFPRQVIEALRLLTHAEGTDYFEYVRAIKANPVAKK